jgi:predicted O-methyltransferase YrrM
MQAASYPTLPTTFIEGLRYCHDPLRVGFHFLQVQRAERLLIHLGRSNHVRVRELWREIGQDDGFLSALGRRYRTMVQHELAGTDFMFLWWDAGSLFFHGIILYILVRLVAPDVVVETGGTPGNSSAFILRALDRNRHGCLCTVDLPPVGSLVRASQGVWLHAGVPDGATSGWAIPDELRSRHRQYLGDAKDMLPQVVTEHPTLDLFIHDSDHSFEHMTWEFETVWPHLKPGGILFADDVRANRAFRDFAAHHKLPAYYTGGVGGLRKPR